jgi:vancomycin resistance protein YoaR
MQSHPVQSLRRPARTLARWGSIAVGLTTALALSTAALWSYTAPRIALDDYEAPRQPADARLGDWLHTVASFKQREHLLLVNGSEARSVPLAAFGVEVDERATELALAEALHPSLAQRWAQRGQIVRVPLRFRVRPEVFAKGMTPLALRVKTDPLPARFDLATRSVIADVNGRALDASATLRSVVDSAAGHRARVKVQTRELFADVRADDLKAVDVSKVLSTHETNFATWGVGVGRSANIRAAAGWLDGTMIAPGGTLSFNDVVGARTLARGFAFAPEIVGDELETGVGGGTCQVASTLHAAALFGALDIVERHAHGRASSYTKLGMDATVAYGSVDLKIRNPYAFPIMVHAYLPKPSQIRIELLGADPQAVVDYVYTSRKSADYFRRVTFKPTLAAGATERHQKGAPGLSVHSQVTIRYADGRVARRAYASEYHPVPEVYWMGPGAVESALPEPGEGVTHTERRGVPEPSAATPSATTSS